MAETMFVKLHRVSGAKFEAKNRAGNSAFIDGPADLGGRGEGMRPMEMLLASLAGCSAVDVLHILDKQRQPLDGLEIEVEGKRAGAVPAVFTEISIVFTASGDVELDKLQHAADLSLEKYCSVAKMLEPTVRISHRVQKAPAPR